MSLKIITDTMCDVPKYLIEQYNIRVLPLTVHFGDESYKDGIDITMEQFYKKLETTNQLPTTSQISPMEFYNIFSEELAKDNEVIMITGSSQISGTYNSAVIAMNQLESDKIRVIDSQGITLGGGMVVIKAARLLEQGLMMNDIVDNLEETKHNMQHYFMVDTLKYLHKGGRISLSAAVLGSILNIKPILTAVNGKLEFLDKARGIKKAITTVLDMIEDSGLSLDDKVIAINHTDAPDQAAMLEEILRSKYKVKEVILGEVGAVVATHAGPGAVALYFEK
jgi:DegV family protein with EDD domain